MQWRHPRRPQAGKGIHPPAQRRWIPLRYAPAGNDTELSPLLVAALGQRALLLAAMGTGGTLRRLLVAGGGRRASAGLARRGMTAHQGALGHVHGIAGRR